MNILKLAQKNYFLVKLDADDDEIAFLDKFKRHIISGKEIKENKRIEHDIIVNSIYNFYDAQFKKITPYENYAKLNNLKAYFKNRILAHNSESKEFKCRYFYKIVELTENNELQCLKLYDNNNIKIEHKYYSEMSNYYTFRLEIISAAPIDDNSKLYHLLPKEESTKILTDYNNDKENILKAYFKTLINLKNFAMTEPVNPLIQDPQRINDVMMGGYRGFYRSYGNILVNPTRVEPERIKMTDYEFLYSMNRINRVKNKKEGSFVQFEAIDMAAEKAKKPFRFKLYYSMNNKKLNIIHCHVIDKDLRTIKISMKEIEKDVDPHTLKKSEDYIKNNELLLLVKEQIPIKLYYKGKKVKTEFIKIEENKLYILDSPKVDSIFNKMYVQVNKIEEQLLYNLTEKCNEFPYSLGGLGNLQDGVDVQVTYDNNKHYIVEPMMLAVSPCLLRHVSEYDEALLKKNKIKDITSNKNITQMDTYIKVKKNMDEYRKYNKEEIGKMDRKQKDDILLKLNQDKESMVGVLTYIEQMEMWEELEDGANISAEIEDLIKLFSNK